MRLTQAILFGNDLERLAAFYGGVLGLVVREGSPADGFMRLDAGGCMLALHSLPVPPAEDPAPAREDAYLKLTFHADDVEAERARLVALGVRMRTPWRFGGIVGCEGLDPEGNVFQISNRG